MASHKTSHRTSARAFTPTSEERRTSWLVLRPSAVGAKPGFTLIEIITVIGIFVVLAGMTLVIGLDGFRGYTFRADRDTLVAALQRARAEAMGNVCLGTGCIDGKTHGVAIESGHVVIFQGTCYAAPCIRNPADIPADEFLDTSPSLTYSGTVSEIVFGQLSGTSTAPSGVVEPWTFQVSDVTGHASVVNVESEGRIWWTN